MYQIYKLTIKNTNFVYIGYTKLPLNDRLKKHFAKCLHRTSKINLALRAYKKKKGLVKIKCVKVVKNKTRAKHWEMRYIRKYIRLGTFDLLNTTAGGNGRRITFYQRTITKLHLCGESNSHAKITENEVREIRALYDGYKMKQSELAIRYGITRSSISKIITRRNWSTLI